MFVQTEVSSDWLLEVGSLLWSGGLSESHGPLESWIAQLTSPGFVSQDVPCNDGEEMLKSLFLLWFLGFLGFCFPTNSRSLGTSLKPPGAS